MTAFSTVESSVLAMKAGAYDYITKPFNPEEVLLLAARAAERAQLHEKVTRLERRALGSRASATEIVGTSPAIVRVMRLVGQVARTDATVLVVGESGTGKELVAQAIHELSPRSEKPFVAVNCGAIPENLQESEFFGHMKGAFTGAIRTKVGLFEQANGGTLFLDEIGETSLSTQVKLLRFLQTGEVRKVGDNTPVHVNVRLVAATNRDLLQMIEQKAFREDLYYRLNIIAVEVPPLRERSGDVEILARYFVAKHARKLGNGVSGFSSEAMERLQTWHWPGNVRELENAIERAVTLSRGTLVGIDDLPRFERASNRGASLTSITWPPAGGEELPSLAEELHRRQIRPGAGIARGEGSGRALSPERQAPGPLPMAASVDAALTVAGSIQAGVGSLAPGSPRPARVPLPSSGEPFPDLESVERSYIEAALRRFGGNRAQACRALGISKATLWRKMKAWEIDA
jgi:DNA-binding NtrC family response regulator